MNRIQKWRPFSRSISSSLFESEARLLAGLPNFSSSAKHRPSFQIHPDALLHTSPIRRIHNFRPIFYPKPQLSSQRRKTICFSCGGEGHIANNCKAFRCFSCGSLGHKRANCRKIQKSEPNQKSPPETRDREDDFPWLLEPSWPNSFLLEDILLLDPDVQRCFDPGCNNSTPVSELLDLSSADLHKKETSMEKARQMEVSLVADLDIAGDSASTCCPFSGVWKLFGPRKVFAAFRLNKGVKTRRLPGKVKLLESFPGLKSGPRSWGTLGKMNMDCSFGSYFPLMAFNSQLGKLKPDIVRLDKDLVILEDCSPESVRIDDLEDFFSDEDKDPVEASFIHFSSKVQCLDEIPSKSKSKKMLPPKKIPKDSKTWINLVPQANVRRSPRLNKSSL